MKINLGVTRFLSLRFMQIAAIGLQLFNTIVVCALYIQSNGWEWWHFLIPFTGLPVTIIMVATDKKKVVPEELQFIYDNHPLKHDIRLILTILNQVLQAGNDGLRQNKNTRPPIYHAEGA